MWNSGFFNALLQDGAYDRKYNADDYSNALSFVVGNGVVNALNGTSFKVERVGSPTASSYALTIRPGWAWINGKWVHNDTDDTTSNIGEYTLDNIAMCAKNYIRVDRLFLCRDDSIGTRAIYPVLRSSSEVRESLTDLPAPIRDSVYEICIAEIHLNYTGDTPIVTVYDKRADTDLCGFVNGYFGDNWEQYCATITNVINSFIAGKTGEFDNWFTGVRDNLATVTLLKPIINTVTASQAGVTFSIGIAEYDPALDILEVYTNGIYEKSGEDYTINATNKTITFTTSKVVGTVIDFVVTKAVDGRFYNNPDEALVASVEERITSITTELENRKNLVERFTYFATGENDNIKLCEKIQNFLNENLTDRRMLRINVVSTDNDFTVTQPCYAGTQSGGLETYNRYFDFSIAGATNRRFILDFANCSPIMIDIPNNTNNILFYGANQHIENCLLKAGDTADIGTKIVAIYGANEIKYVDCKFGITSSSSLEFAYHGIFDDCKLTLTSINGNATAFYPSDGNIVEVNGGVYFLYTTQTAVNNGYETKFIYHSLKDGSATTAVSICRDVSVPNYVRSGYVQGGKLYHTVGGYIRAQNVMTASARTNSMSNTNSEITGAIQLNRAKGQTPFI